MEISVCKFIKVIEKTRFKFYLFKSNKNTAYYPRIDYKVDGQGIHSLYINFLKHHLVLNYNKKSK